MTEQIESPFFKSKYPLLFNAYQCQIEGMDPLLFLGTLSEAERAQLDEELIAIEQSLAQTIQKMESFLNILESCVTIRDMRKILEDKAWPNSASSSAE